MNQDIFWIGLCDIHEQIGMIRQINRFEKAQAILMAGDITNVGNRETAAGILQEVEKINPCIYAQIGNMDTAEVNLLLTEKRINVHAKTVDLGHNVALLGLGYSSPTPFHTPSEASEQQLSAWLDTAYSMLPPSRHLIFMTHTPPYATKTDRLPSGQAVGSRAVRDFIESKQPDVCLCGHIHEATGLDQIGDTQIINPGLFAKGGFAVIKLMQDRLSAELHWVAE